VEAQAVNEFERYRPALAIFFAAPLVMALIFGAVVIEGGSPVQPEFYGPIVYQVPAMAWVAAQSLFSAAAMVGCAMRWCRIGAAGAWLLGSLFLFFATAAIAAGATGTLLVAMAIPSATLSWLAAMLIWRGCDGRRR